MKKQIVVVGIMLVLLAVGLSGCTNEIGGNKNKFVGTWTSTGGAWYHDIIVLYSDGIASLTHHTLSSGDHVQSATWKVNDTHLVLTIESSVHGNYNEYFSYSFPNDETLVLTYSYGGYVGKPTTYKKT